jgi:CMP-N,N'-diacetyllegionaminic acid synthase
VAGRKAGQDGMTFRDRIVIALVPARGGSKGVPRKNLRPLCGKPLFIHTVEAAQGSRFIDEVHVSSDDEDILDLARSSGASATRRSAAAASDTATAADVVAAFAAQLSAAALASDPLICYLQPTSPLRTSAHIDASFSAMDSSAASHGMSVVELKRTPYKSFVLDGSGRLKSLFAEEMSNANRQSLATVFHPNGAIYIFPLSRFLEQRQFPSNGGLPFVMSEAESLDIDSESDFLAAETFLCPN